jgi:release factor glutamine methyltransferase
MSANHAFFQSQVSQIETAYGRAEAEELIYRLIDAYLGKTRLEYWDITGAVIDLDAPEIKRFFEQAIKRLLQFEPVQYIVGHTYFLDYKLEVSPAVLIPRQETEELVSMIIDNEKDNKQLRILDIGTGSGCIPIALSLELDCQEIIGLDISEAALAVAQNNSVLNSAKVDFHQLDILNENIPYQKLDIIVSNPPYVLESDKKQMDKNVLNYEPGLALFVPDDAPLKFYEAIAEKSLNALVKGGRLYFEIHEKFGQEVKLLLQNLGFREIILCQDLFMDKDRMIFTKRK